MGKLSLLLDKLMLLGKQHAGFLIHRIYNIACIWETLDIARHVGE